MSADTDQPQPLLAHLLELRRRLLHSVLSVLLVTLCLLPFANTLYEWISEPLRRWLPPGSSIIATHITAPIVVPFKLAIVTAVFIVIPFLLWQVWSFVAPGLYSREKRLIAPLLVSSVLLFYAGMAFAYWFVCPMVFQFLATSAPTGVAVMTDMNGYLDFVMTMFLAFGAAFEIPVAIVLLARIGVVSVAKLAEVRPYIIVGCFIVGMLLSPPDVLSQTMLAIPMWMLYEIGVLVARFVTPRPAATGSAEA